jgi:heptosyltransferase-2
MKVLFIGLNWLGDIIMSMPAIMSAAEQHEVHVLTRPHLKTVYELFEQISAIHPIANNGPIISSIQKLRRLKSESFDQVIVLPDSIRTAISAWVIGAKSIGYKTQGRGIFLSEAIEKPHNFVSLHESLLHYELVKYAGLADKMAALPKLNFSREQLDELLRKLGIESSRPYFLLAPGAAFGSAKRWPPEKFSQLANLLCQNSDALILVSGSSSEKDLAREIAGTNERIRSIAGLTDLKELAMILSAAKAMVANDSGTMHLAAVFDTPTVIPVGPTDMQRTGSLSHKVRYVYGREKCPIGPCRKKVCPRADHVCMNTISAEMVFESLRQLTGEPE